MVQPTKEVTSSLSTINVTRASACSVTLSSTVQPWSTMELARETHRNLNTSLHTFSSQGSYVTPTEPSMSAGSDTGNAWQEDVTATLWERHVWVQQIVILTYIAMYNSQEHANRQLNKLSYAILRICATWEADAVLIQVRLQVENAWITSHCQQDLVISYKFSNPFSYLCKLATGSLNVHRWLWRPW